jgi:hypothetical protein
MSLPATTRARRQLAQAPRASSGSFMPHRAVPRRRAISRARSAPSRNRRKRATSGSIMLCPFVFIRNTDIGTASLFSRISRANAVGVMRICLRGGDCGIMLPNCYGETFWTPERALSRRMAANSWPDRQVFLHILSRPHAVARLFSSAQRTQQGSRDDVALDLAGAFPDPLDARVAPDALEGQIGHHTETPMNL